MSRFMVHTLFFKWRTHPYTLIFFSEKFQDWVKIHPTNPQSEQTPALPSKLMSFFWFKHHAYGPKIFWPWWEDWKKWVLQNEGQHPLLKFQFNWGQGDVEKVLQHCQLSGLKGWLNMNQIMIYVERSIIISKICINTSGALAKIICFPRFTLL